jgi:hypothetical protein
MKKWRQWMKFKTQQKLVIEGDVLNIMIERVHDENLPISITTGQVIKDYNGDTQVEVLFEFERQDIHIFQELLNSSINRLVAELTKKND